MPVKAVLFDRDGTLNVDTGYLFRREEFRWMPEAPLALAWLKQQGCDIYVITNQSGIARGYFTVEDMEKLHNFMNDDLSHKGVEIKKFYYCPHLEGGRVAEFACACDCRKPKPGLVLECLRENHLQPEECILIGDKERDLQCAAAAGVRGHLYQGGSLLNFVRQVMEGR
ncbi:MAG: HAD family hydrolase [Acidaminococcaceae bacterium]|nr:HAD family hydrolase [Acidaminococcaceae bacterium]